MFLPQVIFTQTLLSVTYPDTDALIQLGPMKLLCHGTVKCLEKKYIYCMLEKTRKERQNLYCKS